MFIFEAFMTTKADLLYQSEPVSAWLSLLDHPEEEERRRAAEKLLEISAAIASVLPALGGVLRNPDSGVRARAATALGDLGAKMLAAMPTLRDALRTIVLTDNEENVRTCAIQSLTRIGPEAYTDVPSLVESLKDDLPYVRMSAANGLGELGSKAKPAVSALTSIAFYDPSPRVRLEAAVAIWRIDRLAVRVMPVLVSALKDPDEVSRWIAADCLGEMGAEAREAVPALQDALKGNFRSRLIRMSIELALQRINPEAAPG
jgi:HEAT repeat protein